MATAGPLERPLRLSSALVAALRPGVDAASDADLLSILLATRTGEEVAKATAVDLLSRLGSLRRVAAASPQELRAVVRLSERGATRVAAAFALGRRAAAIRWRKGEPFRASRDIFDRYHLQLRDARKDPFVTFLPSSVARTEAASEGLP